LVNKKNHPDVMKRLDTLYSRKGLDRVFAIMGQPNPVINDYSKRFAEGETEYPDPEWRALFWRDVCLSYAADLEDDSLPVAYLIEFDQGLMAGMFNADVRMMRNPKNGWISSMSFPFVKTADDLPRMVVDRDNIWFKRYLKQMRLYKDICTGVYGISHLTSLTGLNALMEFMGATGAYYALIDEPDKAVKFFDDTVQFNKQIYDEFFNCIGLTNSGTFGYAAQWVPGKIIADSVDAFHMTSADMFRQFGKKPLADLIDYYDGVMMHIHSNGLHLLEDVCSIKNVKCIQLGDDAKAGFAMYERMDELDIRRGDVPLIISIPAEVFVNRLETKKLHGNVLYLVSNAPDVYESNKIMEKVRAYRR